MKQSDIVKFFRRIVDRQRSHALPQVFRFKGISMPRKPQVIRPTRYPRRRGGRQQYRRRECSGFCAEGPKAEENEEIQKNKCGAACLAKKSSTAYCRCQKQRLNLASPSSGNIAPADIVRTFIGHGNAVATSAAAPPAFQFVPQTAGDVSAGQHLQFQMPLPQTADMSAGQHGHFQIPQQWAGNTTQMLPFNMVPQPHIIYHAAPNGQGPLLLPPNPPGPIQYMPNIAFPQMAVATVWLTHQTPLLILCCLLWMVLRRALHYQRRGHRRLQRPMLGPPLAGRRAKDRRPQRRKVGQSLGQRLLHLSRSPNNARKVKDPIILPLRKRVS